MVIGFEPDSLGTVDCLAHDRRKARLDVLRYGVNVLSQLPNATIYLEAGASDWEPAARTAKQLRYIGISKVRGFMLNVTHHDWTRANIQHGLEISRMVGGKHFIINTSYNGRGPLHYRKWINRAEHKWRTINVWCHPGLRGLGPAPTTATAHPLVDAYMYINRPGYSAGSCNGGPLPVGTWWAERALMYAEYATDWVSPPQGHEVRPLQALLAAGSSARSPLEAERRRLPRARDADDRRACGLPAVVAAGGSGPSGPAGGTRAGSSCRRGRS